MSHPNRAAALANSCKWCGNALTRGDFHVACLTEYDASPIAARARDRRDEQRAENARIDAAEQFGDRDHDADLIGGDEPRDAYEPAIRWWGAEVQP